MGSRTVGEVAAVPRSALVSMLGGGSGRHLHALAHNLDPRPVQVGRRRRSIGSQHALGWRRRSPEAVDAVLVGLVDRVSSRMRSAGRVGRTVVLRLRFDDFTRATRSRTMAQATAQTSTILRTARGLLVAADPIVRHQGLTMVGLAVTNLDDDSAIQLELPFDPRSRSALDQALDEVREKFGSKSITRAIQAGKDPLLSVPMLPD